MRDAVTNVIREKALVKWDFPEGLRGVLARVVRVSDGGLSEGTSGAVTEPMLTIQIDIPIGGVAAGKEPQLREFICVVDPRSDMLVGKILEQ